MLADERTQVMLDVVLAQGGDARWIGPAVRAALFTVAGVALVVVGVRRRRARTRWNRDDDRRLLQSGASAPPEEHLLPTPPSGGGWLIAVGAALVILGVLHLLDLAATLHESGLV
ncbi:hypothetical protein [[Mycobacterium] burgundiense]|uniref:Uncharacterized protein n=1 Tax=[Mycobacterium] burgundiense TaxID=3064286 RepID=A0ABM9LPY9_9MYCO|nr:hypothetical protein [Mycolicibacterium sp. MU0053]CAJ1502749.1 hypothetical protein MU0053_002264 [Mycolicibacterium sp. MU0053]